MTSQAVNAAFDFLVTHKSSRSGTIVYDYDMGFEDEAAAFVRMISATEDPPVLIERRKIDASAEKHLFERCFTVSFGDPESGGGRAGLTLSTTAPKLEDPNFGFYQEMQAHDFELGGVIEWNEEHLTQYSQAVLQSLSSVHIRRFFPWFVWQDVLDLVRPNLSESLRCLDIGCGPISKMRYGALRGWLHIVGVDPLNDVYSAILARHGLNALPKIRPDEIITNFAEDVNFAEEPFRFIYCCNALDHTQDLESSIIHICNSMSDDALALILVYTNEGEKQNYSGLHKYNIWQESGRIMFNSKGTRPAEIASLQKRLSLGRIYTADENVTSFSLVTRS